MTCYRRCAASRVQALLVAALFLAGPVCAQNYTRIVAFGDSWTDPVGSDNDGPSYAYDLAGLLQIPISNYAVSGARSNEINDNQIDAYIASGVDPDALHIYWAVGNDFYEPGAQQDPSTVVMEMTANANIGIQDLQQAGAQHFLVFNFIDNALRPLVITAGGQQQATAVSIEYNDLMDDVLVDRGITSSLMDAFSLSRQVAADPRFSNISQGCEQVSCNNPDQFMWWDDIHPSSETHRMVADGAFAQLTAGPGPSAPVITSTAPGTATVGQVYNYDVNATDADAGDVITYQLTSNPAGMAIDASTGIISWTPGTTQVGNNSVTVSATDTANLSDSQNFVVTVSSAGGGPSAPVITSTAPGTATVGQVYNYDVNATDADAGDVITYQLTSNPAGMVINASTGIISWTPGTTQVGNNSATVSATDTDNLSDSQNFVVAVTSAGGSNPPPATSGGGGSAFGLVLILFFRCLSMRTTRDSCPDQPGGSTPS